MSKQTITAMFDTRAHADQAAAQLRQSGLPAADVIVSPETARDDYAASATYSEKKGFWASLEDMFGGTEDHDTYAEGLRRGSTLLTAHVEDAHVDRSIDILEQHGALDLDERETSWRSEGWTGGSSAAALATPAVDAGAMGLAMTETAAPTTVVTTETRVAAPVAAASVQTAARAGRDDVLQVVEERLDIGKRAVSRGKVRLHASVIEKNVSESVTLRGETVTVDRRPVDRAVSAAGLDIDPFKERVIEMEEYDEQAVVAKTAHVIEEIGIRKDGVDRVETVTDTLRSTKVDIEDGRTLSTASTLVGKFVSEIRDDMEVVGSDGVHVGTVDHLDGDRIKLKKIDPAAGGQHHYLSLDTVKSVAGKVILAVTAAQAKTRWTAA